MTEDKESMIVQVFYNSKQWNIELNINDSFGDWYQTIEDSLPSLILSQYDIVYKLSPVTASKQSRISEIISEDDTNPTLLLRKKVEFIPKPSKSDTSVILEFFPSFMDLSQQIQSFCKTQKGNTDFNVDYKNNWCKISFKQAEIAFSFVQYMTQIKWDNAWYKKLKINWKYNWSTRNHVKPKLKPNICLSEGNIWHASNSASVNGASLPVIKMQKKKSNTNNIYLYKPTNSRWISLKHNWNSRLNWEESEYIRNSAPYDLVRKWKQEDNADQKKKWLDKKGFINTIGNYGINQVRKRQIVNMESIELIREKNKKFIKNLKKS